MRPRLGLGVEDLLDSQQQKHKQAPQREFRKEPQILSQDKLCQHRSLLIQPETSKEYLTDSVNHTKSAYISGARERGSERTGSGNVACGTFLGRCADGGRGRGMPLACPD